MPRIEMERALQRPLNYGELPPRQQWCIDEELGILDWDPGNDEADEYIRRRAEMGDKQCREIMEKRAR